MSLGVTEALTKPSVEVFAFQEMDKRTGAPQNDKPIFSAVTSLMKAQAYELSALPQRKKEPSVYQFNLLSVVDADLARLMFTEKGIKCTEITSEQHLARYIIKKKETFSRIRFLKADTFQAALPDYSRLHIANQSIFAQAYEDFYKDIFSDSARTKVLAEEFRKSLSFWLNWEIERNLSDRVDVNSFGFLMPKDKSKLRISVDLDQNQLDLLNSSDRCKERTAVALKKIYKYEGPFEFDYDIPF